MRKDRAERGQYDPDRGRIDFVCLKPLQEQPIRGQPGPGRFVVLAGVQTGDPGTVGIRRLGDDQVVGLRCREQHLAAVIVEPPDFGMMEHVAVHRRADLGNLVDRRLQFDHVDAVHRRQVGQPAGRLAGAQSDHQGRFRLRVEDSAHQGRADLRGGIADGVPVRLAVHDERPAVLPQQGNARLDAVRLPGNRASPLVRPIAPCVGRPLRQRGSPRADAAVPPGGGRPMPSKQDRGPHDHSRRNHQRRSAILPPCREHCGGQSQDAEDRGGRGPGARRTEPGKDPEPAGERSGDGPQGVPREGRPHVPADRPLGAAQKANQKRKLHAARDRRRKDDNPRDNCPAENELRKRIGPFA